MNHPICAATTLLLASTVPLRGQTPVDHLRGRVTDDSAHVVVGASVIVTRGPDRAVKQTTTDSSGRYAIAFENGTGDYLVSVAAAGFRTARRRVQIAHGELDVNADFRLGRAVDALAAVKVEVKKPERGSRDVNPFTAEPGAAEKWFDGIAAQLPPSLAGDLNALASTMPGLTQSALGPSFLGAAPSSNLTTLNGMALAVGALPRAARLQTRVTATTFDPTRGGFAGANIDSRLAAGSRSYQQRNAFTTIDVPQLHATDAVGRSLGLASGSWRASAGADGELIRRALTYNVALEASRSTSDAATLLDASPDAWLRSGLAADSVRRVIDVARALGIPLSGSRESARERTSIAWLGRLDDTRDSLAARTLTTIVSRSRDGTLGVGPVTAPAAGGSRDDATIGAQLQLTNFFGAWHRVLNETRLALSRSTSATSPHLALPAASVLVRSQAQDGNADLTSIAVGGAPSLASESAQWTVEGANESIWFANGRTHRFKLLAWGRVDSQRQSGAANLLGQYGYPSLAAFAANAPSSYARTLTPSDREGTVWNGAMAVAHQWNKSRWFNLLYGARIEADGFARAPARNTALEQALGVTTGAAPARVHVSPRVGFQWTYNRDKNNGNGMTMSQMGQFFRTRTGVVRGGVGEFRDLLRAGVLADAATHTGLPGSAQSLTCVGAAVPVPDWRELASAASRPPVHCVDGSGVLGELARGVTLINPSFDVPRSWRASLDWNANLKRWIYKLSGVVSYDLSQPGTVDANFAGVPRFVLGGSDARPVFVSPAAIDVASGTVSAAESRRSDLFGRTSVRTSDLRGVAEQLTLSLAPDPFRRAPGGGRSFLSGLYGAAAYTWQRSARQVRGFDGGGYGDPRVKEWAPSANDARHIVILQGGSEIPKVGTLTMFARLQSGLPFTPIVQGDLDGDGRSGDRAFVPHAATEPDAAVARSIRALLSDGSVAARKCLGTFAGRVASRNGCRGPWTATLNAQWRPELPGKLLSKRLSANVYFQNVLGGLDQLLHGANRMRGWGMQAAPDPVLLVPRAFDPVARQFRYDVNPRFGDTRPTRTLLREPFRVTIDFQFRLSTDYDLQQLRRALEPVKGDGRWMRRGADSLASYYLKNTSNLHAMILAESDSLFLTASQIDALRGLDSAYSERVRLIYRPLAQYLSTFAGGTASKAALDSTTAAGKAYWREFWQQPEKADSVLTPVQRELLPVLGGMLRMTPKEREQSQMQLGYPVKLSDRRRLAP